MPATRSGHLMWHNCLRQSRFRAGCQLPVRPPCFFPSFRYLCYFAPFTPLFFATYLTIHHCLFATYLTIHHLFPSFRYLSYYTPFIPLFSLHMLLYITVYAHAMSLYTSVPILFPRLVTSVSSLFLPRRSCFSRPGHSRQCPILPC
jgi:hypothetical protein